KQRAVLALLALDAGRVVTLDRIVDVLWGDAAPERAEVSIRSYVSHLRRALAPHTDTDPIIEFRRPGYVLHLPPDAVDVVAFERRVEDARRRLDEGDPRAA